MDAVISCGMWLHRLSGAANCLQRERPVRMLCLLRCDSESLGARYGPRRRDMTWASSSQALCKTDTRRSRCKIATKTRWELGQAPAIGSRIATAQQRYNRRRTGRCSDTWSKRSGGAASAFAVLESHAQQVSLLGRSRL